MGRKSTKENKSIYQLSREEAGLTREKAAEVLEFITADKLEKLENEKSPINPSDVVAMAKGYKKPSLCNYYCSHECPIGQMYVPEVELKSLSQITVEMLASLDALEKEKSNILQITVDGKITEDEMITFNRIKNQLSQISLAADSLQLWVEQAVTEGKISE